MKFNPLNDARKMMLGAQLLVLVSYVTKVQSADLKVPIGDINVLVLTDVHSWVAGRSAHEPHLDADYGDVLSFYERLRTICNKDYQTDLFFVMNGDFMTGTGLSTDPPIQLSSILSHMPWDAITVGNHDIDNELTTDYLLYNESSVVNRIWGDKYITSNVVRASQPDDNNQSLPMGGSRYLFLKGELSNTTILTFGFLYNFDNFWESVNVEKVESVVQQDWFQNVLSGEQGYFDAIMVLAHMDVKDSLVYILLNAIRNVCGMNMPVQFITGHTHRRDVERLDKFSSSFEAGHFLDTVGFVSFPTKTRISNLVDTGAIMDDSSNGNDLFRHLFMDANVDVLRTSLGGDNDDNTKFSTDAGKKLTNFIQDAQHSMGLLEVIGCSKERYEISKGLDEEGSLWRLYTKNVIPSTLLADDSNKLNDSASASNHKKIFIQNIPWTFYNDLYNGEITVTDIVSIAPSREPFYLLHENIDGYILRNLVDDLSYGQSDYMNGVLPNYAVVGDSIVDDEVYDLYGPHNTNVISRLTDLLPNDETIVPQKLISNDPHSKGDDITAVSLLTQYISNDMSCPDIGYDKSWYWFLYSRLLDDFEAAILFVLIMAIISSKLCNIYHLKKIYTGREVVQTHDENII